MVLQYILLVMYLSAVNLAFSNMKVINEAKSITLDP